MNASDMIEKYNISYVDDTRINLRPTKKITEKELEEVKAAKPEIIAELKARIAAEELAKANAAAELAANVPGLDELRNAREEWSDYRCRYEKYIASGACSGGPAKPAVSVDEITAKYPVAAAYLKAEGYANAANYRKAAAGRKAKEAIANGADYKAALEQMEAEWTAAANENLWN